MNNKKIILTFVGIVVLGVVACFLSYKSGVVTGMQSASINKAVSAVQVNVGGEEPGNFKTSRFKCWLYGGTWYEYPGHNWDCKWLKDNSSVNYTQ